MDPTRFRQNVQNGDALLGAMIHHPCESIIESIGHLWDFLWLDGQHGQISYDRMLSMQRTADLVGVDTVIRVPGREIGTVGLFADMAPSAVMIPMVNTREDAQAAVKALRFPPQGSRSFGGRRCVDTLGRTYYLEREPLLVAQIETKQAVDNCEEIAAVDGVDVLMLGPDDFKTHLGLAINSSLLDTPVLYKAFEKVAQVALNAGKRAMCITPSPELLKHAKQLKYNVFVGGSDVGFLQQGALKSSQTLKVALKELCDMETYPALQSRNNDHSPKFRSAKVRAANPND